MAAVRRGVDERVRRPCRQAALEHGLERRVRVVLAREREVVDKEDEAHRQRRNLIDEAREVHERLLRHLDHAQAARVVLVQDRLHRGGFAGAAVAVEQAVVRRQAHEEGHGVVDRHAALDLVALEVAQRRAVRVFHRVNAVVVPDERAVARIHAAAVFAVKELEPVLQAAGARELLHRLAAAPGGQREVLGARRAVLEQVGRRERAELQDHAQVAPGGFAQRGWDLAPGGRRQREGVLVIERRLRERAGEVAAHAALAQGREERSPRAQKRFVRLRPEQVVKRLRHRAAQNPFINGKRGHLHGRFQPFSLHGSFPLPKSLPFGFLLRLFYPGVRAAVKFLARRAAEIQKRFTHPAFCAISRLTAAASCPYDEKEREKSLHGGEAGHWLPGAAAHCPAGRKARGRGKEFLKWKA